MYSEDDYLMISGLQHYSFCPRQWALIHIEQQWEENLRTVDGEIMHENAHDDNFRETRKGVIITRAMPVSSRELGFSGECDIVEFVPDSGGVTLGGKWEKYIPVPIEYKRGSPKKDDCDILQLAAQAMCLEEMLCCEIKQGYIFYGETRRREKIEFEEAVFEKVREYSEQMHRLFERRYTPKVKRRKGCNACSLKNLCLPEIMQSRSVKDYLSELTENTKGEG
ncbi:CRISPR-associated protein Cas4 [Ruminococcus sp.]|uniref:CRISPR-associated protein Cas4 n=1 Tax=Ruminococcus sp. TaxID=41978 RepID=UPI0025EFC5EB|nr:CRISPR-associated protein Cas4 [Ruminococcus sp.]